MPPAHTIKSKPSSVASRKRPRNSAAESAELRSEGLRATTTSRPHTCKHTHTHASKSKLSASSPLRPSKRKAGALPSGQSARNPSAPERALGKLVDCPQLPPPGKSPRQRS